MWDLNPNYVAVIMDFIMYHSEVIVKQENHNTFLVVEERLRVRGLCQGYKGAAPDSRDVSSSRSEISNAAARGAKSNASRRSEASDMSSSLRQWL